MSAPAPVVPDEVDADASDQGSVDGESEDDGPMRYHSLVLAKA